MATIEYFDAKQLLMKEKQQCSEQVSGTVQNLIKISVNISDFGGDQKFEDSSYEQNIAMKVPAAPLVVSSAVKDNDKSKAVYAFLKYYYGEEAAKDFL